MENGKNEKSKTYLKNNHNSLWKYNSFVYIFTLWIIALK